jgi:AsmA protein
MKPSQLPWRWLLFGLLAVLILGVALIPRLIGDTSRFGDRVAAELSSWTGGEVKFTGPVLISFFPDVSVRGELELTDSSRLPLMQSLIAKEAKISLDLVDLLRGRVTIDTLRLLEPKITLREGAWPGASAGQAPQALIANLLTGAPLRVLHVRKGRIALSHAYGGSIREIYAHFDAGEETGAVSGFGSFAFRDVTVRYSLESGSPTAAADAESLPVTLTITSKPIRAKINGTASYAGELKLDGDVQAEIDDLRRFLNWVGMDLPEGESLKGFSAAGAFHLAGSTLTFDDGSFTLDGNNAVGLLAVTAAPLPPRIEGTLAFDRLVLDPYLGNGPASAPGAPPAIQGSPFDQSLLRYFDADLRISAAEIDAGAAKLGRGGFTITAKQGAVTSELGELELCGGSAEGRLSVDLARATTPLNLVVNLAGVSLDSCLQPLGFAAPFKGTGGLKAELSTEGSDVAELTRNLTGTIKVDARDGAVPVDFARLLATTAPLDNDGWSRDAASSFDQLNADCSLSAGHIWCQTLSMQTPGGRFSGAGDVDLPKQTLDWSLSVGSRNSAVNSAQQTEEDTPKVSIRGSLSQPMIRRADRPTLGEGSLQTSPMEPQVLPH